MEEDSLAVSFPCKEETNIKDNQYCVLIMLAGQDYIIRMYVWCRHSHFHSGCIGVFQSKEETNSTANAVSVDWSKMEFYLSFTSQKSCL